jgi:addiction module RelE/StbE family toxin
LWKILFDNRFKREYKKLDKSLQKRINDIIKELAASNNPRQLGVHKTARYNCIHAYEIGKQYRILYDIDENSKTVTFLSVGTHKIY